MNLPARLRLKGLWLKWSFPFLWAHKPLCDRFAEDRIRLGGIHLCRSCLCAYGGLFLGVGLALLAPLQGPGVLIAYGAVLPSVLLLSWPTLYKKWPRSVRDLLRCAGGALIPVSAALCLSPHFWAGLPGLLLIAAFWIAYFRQRKRRKLKACNGCAELGTDRICSGFALQAERIRRYEREATELVMRGGYVPACAKKHPTSRF